MAYKPWQLGAIDDAGYNGIREQHLEKVANALRATGQSDIDRATFDRVCRQCGIDSNNFTQADLNSLQEKLNG
jgi:hypothetical protein